MIRFARFRDDRGYFTETFRKSDLLGHAARPAFKASSSSRPTRAIRRRAWSAGCISSGIRTRANWCRTIVGRIIDLALDIRKGSPTFGKVIAYDLPSLARRPLWRMDLAAARLCPLRMHGREVDHRVLLFGGVGPGNEAGISPLAADIDWSLCDA